MNRVVKPLCSKCKINTCLYVEKNTENHLYCKNEKCHRGQTYKKNTHYCIIPDCHEISVYVEKNTKNKTYCENELCHRGQTYKNGNAYCIINNCHNHADYCEKNGNKSIYCEQHVVELYGIKFKTSTKYCKFEGCTTTATFGHKTDKLQKGVIVSTIVKIFCAIHNIDPENPSKSIHEDTHPKCQNCHKHRATHGELNEIDDETNDKYELTHCGACNTSLNLRLINLSCSKCKIKDIDSTLKCTNRANYGDSFECKLILCSEHVEIAHAKTGKNYIYLSARLCKFKTNGIRCVLQPTYGLPGTETPLFCAEHRDKLLHVNVVSKMCEHPNCMTRPSFGIRDGPAIFCESHRDAEIHINVVSARCIHLDCDNLANYAAIDTTKAILCKLHKTDVKTYNIKDKYYNRCTESECSKIATFGSATDQIAIFCLYHKTLHGMDDLIDVKNKKCTDDDCKIAPWYGYLGLTPCKCARHYVPGMIPKPIKRCIRCQKTASHVKNQEFYCTKCKDTDAQDFRFSCSICYSTLKEDKQVCNLCIEFLKTNKTIKRQQKELKIKAYLEQNNVIIKSYDRAIGESRKRPDFIIERPNGNIIIECDEYQHLGNKADYTCRCEILRMNQIYFDLFDTTSTSENKVLFIRFNPDEYESNDTRATMDERLGQLYNLVSTFDFDDLEGHLGIKYLFYDQHADNANIDIINPYIEI